MIDIELNLSKIGIQTYTREGEKTPFRYLVYGGLDVGETNFLLLDTADMEEYNQLHAVLGLTKESVTATEHRTLTRFTGSPVVEKIIVTDQDLEVVTFNKLSDVPKDAIWVRSIVHKHLLLSFVKIEGKKTYIYVPNVTDSELTQEVKDLEFLGIESGNTIIKTLLFYQRLWY